ncbi:MAG: hypothetical protein M3P18_08305 [Actinomycetota bacterium]|nr:hypothetical protein [Actinomycetota bacterium]
MTLPESQQTADAFECSREFLFFDYFRVPHRVNSAGAGTLGSLADRFGYLRWSKPGSRFLVWAVEDSAASHAAPAAGLFLIEGIPICGAVLSDAAVEEAMAQLGGKWSEVSAVTDHARQRISSIWRDSNGSVLLPFDPSAAIYNLWSERYQRFLGQSLARRSRRLTTACYYLVRPLIPRSAQLALRRAFSKIQKRRDFPRWPIEPGLHDFYGWLFRTIAELAEEPVPWLSPWPAGYSWALVLTHDVETHAGYESMDALRNIETRLGFRSSWNLAAGRYRVADAVVAQLLAEGFEVGVHGLYHDGRDLEGRYFARRLPTIQEHAHRWAAAGFRSPATRRIWERMPALGFDYDSSYPDTDPFEPDPGGCCSWLPFFNDNLVELPITLPQDHTLFVILRHTNERAWTEKADYLRERGGMALLVTHPDYLLESNRRAAYARLLERYAHDETAWRALPRDVSAWWRRRSATSIKRDGTDWYVSGPAADTAQIRWADPAAAENAATHPLTAWDR